MGDKIMIFVIFFRKNRSTVQDSAVIRLAGGKAPEALKIFLEKIIF
jgi:hypothetical protein